MSESPRQPGTWKRVVAPLIFAVVGSSCFTLSASAQQGASKDFAILSSADVTLKNRVNVNPVSVSPTSCPGTTGCSGNVGGTTVLMGRGNASAPDNIGGDVIASAPSTQGMDCSSNPPGTTAICLGNDSEIAGACVTGGGAVSAPSECDGADTGGNNSEVTTLLPNAISDAASLSATLAALAPTQTLPAIVLSTRGSTTISATGALTVVAVPSIASGTNSTITLSGTAADIFVINVGSATDPGSLQIGNGASVLLSGGITPDHVIFNLIGAGTTAQLGNHNVFNGTIVAAQGQFTSGDGDTPNPVLINGALLFGGSIAIGNNTNLNFYPFAGTGSGSGTGSGGGTSGTSGSGSTT